MNTVQGKKPGASYARGGSSSGVQTVLLFLLLALFLEDHCVSLLIASVRRGRH